jgi:hypothetical protein
MHNGAIRTPRTIKEAEAMVRAVCPGVRLAGRDLRGREKLSMLKKQLWILYFKKEKAL